MSENSPESLPLSAAQLEVWYAQLLDEGNPIWNIAECHEITGPLRMEVFSAAVTQAVTEAECLRVRFETDGDEIRQIVEPLAEPPLRIVDLRGEADPAAAADEWMRADLRTAANLSAPPLYTMALLRTADESASFFMRAHHVLWDGFSEALFARRVGAIYTAMVTGGDPGEGAFPPLADLLADEASYLESKQAEKDRDFWAARFPETPQLTTLAGTEIVPAESFFRTGAVVDAATTERLRAVAWEERAAWPTFVIAATAAYLQRMAGTAEVMVSMPVTARTTPAMRAIPGMRANVLPLPLAVHPGMTRGELVSYVGKEVSRTLRHQRRRGQRVREQMGLGRDDTRPFGPELNVASFIEELKFGPCTVRSRNLSTAPNDDLSITVHDLEDGGLKILFDGNPRLYDEEALDRLVRRLRGFLVELGSCAPSAPVGTIDLVDGDERALVLGKWLDTERSQDFTDVATTVQRIADARPDAVAVVDSDGETSYAELCARAAAVTRQLAGAGLAKGEMVAVLDDRGAGFIAAVLGVWAAGGAYVPLDPQAPIARQSQVLTESGAAVVLAGAPYERGGRELDGEHAVYAIPAHGERGAGLDPVVVTEDDLAYVIFTSGSTGRPKGAMVTHGGMVNHLRAKIDDLDLSGEDRIVQNAPLSFDISVWQMMDALLLGGTVRVVDRDTASDPSALFGVTESEGVTILEVVPSLLRAALDVWDDGGKVPELALLRSLVVTGEALPPDLCVRWFERFGAIPMVNAYGPTECADDVTHAVITPSGGLEGPRVPIGHAVRNTRLYVLGDGLRPVPVGVPGELYVAGAGVGRGYLADAARTAVTFLPDPFQRAGARMYRTGDVVRYREDGQLEFLERRDRQVKIRGHRIEVAEVEVMLRTLPGVADAVVVVGTDSAGQKRLVAYLAGEGEPEDWRAGTERRLPAYLVPSAFVKLPELPLTPNGKVDHKALPTPELDAATDYRAPATGSEELVTAVYAEVLGVEQVGVDDGFFELGGHSLLGTRVLSRLRQATGIELTLRDLFSSPRAGDLAALLVGPVHERPVLARGVRPERIPLSPGQYRMWFLDKLEGPSGTYNVPSMARLTGKLDRVALERAFWDLIDRHETLRTVFRHDDGEPYQVVLEGVAAQPPMEVVEIDEDELEDAVLDAAAYAFDLSAEIPVRPTLLALGEDDHVLLVVVHHISTDGWSVAALASDMNTAYNARLRGTAPDWAPLEVQYIDYALWQEQFLGDPSDEDSVIAEQLAYWSAELTGINTDLNLPLDRPRPSTRTYHGDTVYFPIGAELHEKIVELANSRGATPFMVVQAALCVLLGKLGGSTDIPLGSPIAGRMDPLLDPLVGLFINTVLLRSDLSGDPAFADLLDRVRETDLAAYGHQDVPFERILEILNPVRSAGTKTPFQVIIAFQNNEKPVIEMAGLSGHFELATNGTAKFDIAFNFVEDFDEGRPDGIDGSIEYSTDLFYEDTMLRLGDRLVCLLESAMADPATPLSQLDVLGAGERDTILREWSRRAVAVPAMLDGLPVTPPSRPKVYLLDEHMALVPPGVTGQWFVAADRIKLTDEASGSGLLVPNPFGKAGSAMIATGRQGRWSRYGEPEVFERVVPVVAAEATAAEDAEEEWDGSPRPQEPRNEHEEILCGLFAEVLGRDRIGIDDNFFKCGGNSLRVGKLIGRVQSALQTAVTIRDVFENQTVAKLAAKLGGARVRPALVAGERPEVVPLSFAQRRLWFLNQFEGPGAAYNIPIAVRLTGTLDRAAMSAAVRDLVGRHEVLRTVYPDAGGEGRQQVLDVDEVVGELPVTKTDAAHLDEDVRAAAMTGFDVTVDPPLRASLFEVSADEHVLLLLVHHIASDGWSTAPMARDLADAYKARLDGGAPEWAPLPVQYTDFALWQRKLLGDIADSGSLVAKQTEYWRTALAGLPDELPLPADRPRPVEPTYRGDIVDFRLDAGLHERLDRFAKDTGTTAFMVLQAALAATLSQFGAGTDVPLGTLVAGRTDDAVEDLVGFFVNTLVLRADLSGNPSFRHLLAQLRETDLAGYGNQDVPFESLVEALNPARARARHPLFQVAITVHNNDAPDVELPGLVLTSELIRTNIADLDLHFEFIEEQDGGTCAGIASLVKFSVDLFDRRTVESLASGLVRLLDQALADPDLPLSRVLVLGSDEVGNALVTPGDTARPNEITDVVARVAELARTQPSAVAVSDERGRMDYAGLAAAAGSVTESLRAQRVEPGSLVALLAERGTGYVAAVLGVLGAGCAYLPLDAAAPSGRTRGLLDEAGPALLLADGGHRALAVELAGDLGVLELDLTRTGEWNPATGTDLDLAYVLYTSGSTGKPKGAMVHRGGMVNHLLAKVEDLGLTERDVVVHNAPVTFDISVWQMLAPIVAGGRAHVVSGETARDPLALFDTVTGEGVTVLEVVPSLLAATLDTWDIERAAPEFPGLRWLVVTGEALPPKSCARWLERHPRIPVMNAYGPTECSDDVTHATVEAAPAGARTPIGTALRNTGLYVLDAWLRPVPSGVAGELYVGGLGVGRGYLGAPGKTAAVFLPDPFAGTSGARMYRTGDVVTRGADGQITFLHRADDQVKIRGNRIELGEIEAALRSLPEVADAVVQPYDDGSGARLAAHLVLTGELSDGELKDRLGSLVPPYMLPSAYLRLDRFPLTPNGKVDRKALVPPSASAVEPGRAPSTPRELALRKLFAEVLDGAELGADDAFFDHGGHSLLATRLASRIRTELGAEVSVRDVFDHPTIAGLAARLDGARVRPPLVAGERPELVPLSYAQRRLWFLNQFEGPNAAYTIPIAVRLRGELDTDALASGIRDLLGRHEVLRTVYPESDGEGRQRILGVDEAFTGLSVVATPASELDGALAEEVRAGFDVTVDPPLRATLFALGEDEHVLLLAVHHIATDGWSAGPLAADLARAYTARLHGAGPEWTPLPVQYADYSLWQRELLGDADDRESLLAKQIGHWRGALAELPDELPLPHDHPRPAEPTYAGGMVTCAIGAEQRAGIEELAKSTGTTAFMVLHAALAATLAAHGGGTDIPLGTPVAGRTDDALDDLIGFFINTLVLRTDLSGDPSFRALLARVRETDLAAQEHQDVPFESLVEALNPPRSQARHPLFQVMLVLQNNRDAHAEFPGLAVDAWPVDTGAAQFDLHCEFVETGDGLDANIGYSAEVFDRESVLSLVSGFQRLLAGVLADPDAPALGVAAPDEVWERRFPRWRETRPSTPDVRDVVVVAGREPSTPRERLLHELFTDVLGTAELGVDESFFDRGGHSLLASRLVSRIRVALDVRLTIKDLFDHPTVARLASRVDRLGDGTPFDVLLPLRREGGRAPVFCVHPAGCISWSYLGLSSSLVDRPIYGLQARGIVEDVPLPADVREMAADYLAQIRVVRPHGPYHLLGWSLGGVVAHEIACQLQAQGEEVALLASLDSAPGGDESELIDDESLAATALRFFGLRGDEPAVRGPDFDGLAALLRGTDTPMADLSVEQLKRCFAAWRNNLALQVEFTPGVFRGTMVHFVAAEEVGNQSAGQWKSYVDGTIECHEVVSTHEGMTDGEVLRQIGTALERQLAQQEDTEERSNR
ncbi:amino acid adenylation domain-containing protein [Amycolatopsis minnesotensis]|uniref:Carrier domain-containing protein n=1 Tax=Amycolatopsis minnesotensis TaxID=337894 RepID=A0ABN2PZA5_9PSEU